MKRLIRILLLTLAAVFLLPQAVSAAEERPADLPLEVTICALNEDDQEYLTLPESLQCWSAGGRTIQWVSGCDVDIRDGAVWPYGEMMYWHQNGPGGYWIGSNEPSGQPGEIANFEYDYGDCVIRVGGLWDVTVHVVSYETYYAEQVIDGYLAAHVTEGMTDYQIAELCCQFVASFEYNPDATTYASLISRGGGDCWASTSALLYMLRQQGIVCQSRDASTDPNAGIGHVNVVALLDGAYYILEAGYAMPAPRAYDLTRMETSTVFTYREEYVGQDRYEVHITGLILEENVTEIFIPREIDGMPVTEIAGSAFLGTDLVSVTLPDTIRVLGDKAFMQCHSLAQINLPEGLETIGLSCFVQCESLTEMNIPSTVTSIAGNVWVYDTALTAIHVHPDNPVYASRDGVLFDKAMETLLTFPAGKGEAPVPSTDDLVKLQMEYTIPDTVRTIGAYAFSVVSLKQIHIPQTVTQIREYAFHDGCFHTLILPEGIDSIASFTFRQTAVYSVTMPAGLKRIENFAFYETRSYDAFRIPEGVEYVGACAFAKGYATWIVVPASVREIGAQAFDIDMGAIGGDSAIVDGVEVPSRHNCGAIFMDRDCQPEVIGAEAFDDETVCVYPDSYMHRYAVENDLFWYPRKSDGTIELKQEWLNRLSDGAAGYTGQPVEPEPLWKCTEGYSPFYIRASMLACIYENNVNIGSASVTIQGKELLSGSVCAEFTIHASDPHTEMTDRSGCGLQYRIIDDHVQIVSYIASALPETLVIPETLEGLPVTAIAYGALQDCALLTEVTIPGSVTEIGGWAFQGTTNLKTIRFTGDMPRIGMRALAGITALYPADNDTWDLTALQDTDALEWLPLDESHEMGQWVRELEPTCTEAGSQVRTCTRCGMRETEIIPAVGHDPVPDAAVAPTCTTAGLTEGSHCARCSAVLVPQEEIPATCPLYVAVVTEPTCTAQGYTTHTCPACGDEYVDAYTAALGHLWDGGRCTRCGETDRVPGDVNEDGVLNDDDAIYLLYHTLFGGDLYPVTCGCDFDGSGKADSDDAVYLLYHTLFGGDLYPLH